MVVADWLLKHCCPQHQELIDYSSGGPWRCTQMQFANKTSRSRATCILIRDCAGVMPGASSARWNNRVQTVGVRGASSALRNDRQQPEAARPPWPRGDLLFTKANITLNLKLYVLDSMSQAIFKETIHHMDHLDSRMRASRRNKITTTTGPHTRHDRNSSTSGRNSTVERILYSILGSINWRWIAACWFCLTNIETNIHNIRGVVWCHTQKREHVLYD